MATDTLHKPKNEHHGNAHDHGKHAHDHIKALAKGFRETNNVQTISHNATMSSSEIDARDNGKPSTASQSYLADNLKVGSAIDLARNTDTFASLDPRSIKNIVQSANLKADSQPNPADSTQPAASTATAAETTTPQNLQVTATRGRKLALEILEASLKDGKINEATKYEQTAYLASTSDTQVADKTAKMLQYADAKREEMLRFTDKSFDDLRKGDFTVSGIKVKAIEDKEALGRIESRHASEEDKVKYKTYIDEFENATKLREQLKSGTDLEIIARADDIARKKEEEANGQFLKTASSAAKMVSEELGAVIELLSPFLAKFMGNTQSTAQMIDVLPDIPTQGQATTSATVAAPLADANNGKGNAADVADAGAPKPSTTAAASTTASFGNNDGLPESERSTGAPTVATASAPTQTDVAVADASPPATKAAAAAPEPEAKAAPAPVPAANAPTAAKGEHESDFSLTSGSAWKARGGSGLKLKEGQGFDFTLPKSLEGRSAYSGEVQTGEPVPPAPAKSATAASTAKGRE
jgi:hypothetical protein